MLFSRRNIALVLVLALGLLAGGQPATGETAASRPALYEFGAGFCLACKQMEKVIAEVKGIVGDRVEFRMLLADKDKKAFQDFKVVLVPTLVFLDAEGKEVFRHLGTLTREQVLAKFKELKFIEE